MNVGACQAPETLPAKKKSVWAVIILAATALVMADVDSAYARNNLGWIAPAVIVGGLLAAGAAAAAAAQRQKRQRPPRVARVRPERPARVAKSKHNKSNKKQQAAPQDEETVVSKTPAAQPAQTATPSVNPVSTPAVASSTPAAAAATGTTTLVSTTPAAPSGGSTPSAPTGTSAAVPPSGSAASAVAVSPAD